MIFVFSNRAKYIILFYFFYFKYSSKIIVWKTLTYISCVKYFRKMLKLGLLFLYYTILKITMPYLYSYLNSEKIVIIINKIQMKKLLKLNKPRRSVDKSFLLYLLQYILWYILFFKIFYNIICLTTEYGSKRVLCVHINILY